MLKKIKKEKTELLSFRIKEDELLKLKELSENNNLPLSEVLRQIIDFYLDYNENGLCLVELKNDKFLLTLKDYEDFRLTLSTGDYHTHKMILIK